MPIYEFRCTECADVFDTLVRTMSAEGVRCPSCGSGTLTRLISSFAVSRSLTPCGTRASDAPRSCGLGGGDDSCASCCRVQA